MQLTGKNITAQGKVKLLTSCPACQQDLSRYTDDSGLETDFIDVELCNHNPGENWQREFVASVNAGGIEQVLLQPVGFQQRHKQATAPQRSSQWWCSGHHTPHFNSADYRTDRGKRCHIQQSSHRDRGCDNVCRPRNTHQQGADDNAITQDFKHVE